jgi:hypothetical protein
MCGPYPAEYDSSQTDPSCAAAIAAWPAEQTALSNGSNSCASPPSEDGGTSEDGGGDATTADAGGPEDAAVSDANDGGAPVDALPE